MRREKNTYNSSLAHFMSMFGEAFDDFRTLTIGKVDIKQYGGDRHKRRFGIEFTPTNDVPEKYEWIHQVEVTL